ncbi:MAG TPA: hypothetical protein VHX39_11875, partial [Acetobacteraceae bacterium]|nr:hypothetical protein [Acetobacteraceae bacterium]
VIFRPSEAFSIQYLINKNAVMARVNLPGGRHDPIDPAMGRSVDAPATWNDVCRTRSGTGPQPSSEYCALPAQT